MPEQLSVEKPVVLVYAEPLLARSMTFIRSQAETLTSFCPLYISPHYLMDGLPLPRERVVVMHRGDGRFSRLADIPFKTLGVAPIFIRRLKRLRPALLHAHFGPMGLRAMPLARRLRIPLLVTFHGYDATTPDECARRSQHYAHRTYVKRRKELELGASVLIAVSNFVRSQLVRQGYAEEKVEVHYIGVDTEVFRPQPEVEREPIVLFTGRLEEVKGCEYLISAMAKVQAAIPHAGLVIIGDGSLRSQLERRAKESLRSCHFLGYQSPEVVKHWMNRARVFAAPSVRTPSGSEEGCPTVLMEAQAMALPVVSNLTGGVPEAVSNGETGFLSPERDVESLARNLQTLLADEALSAQMGRAGRNRVCARFDLRAQTRKLEELYMRALAGELGQPTWDRLRGRQPEGQSNSTPEARKPSISLSRSGQP
jgi:colanic acid/amylovoran biosynthesis glycosyltransferase